jgi:hypothetical protein
MITITALRVSSTLRTEMFSSVKRVGTNAETVTPPPQMDASVPQADELAPSPTTTP